MSNGGVDGYDQVELGNYRCGIGEVEQVVAEMMQRWVAGEKLPVIIAKFPLQTNEDRAAVEQRQQLVQRDRAVAIVRVGRIAGPREADAWRAGGQPGAPMIHFRRRWREVGSARRNGLQGGSECQRQARQRALEIEFRQLFALGCNVAGELEKQGFQCGLHLQNHVCATFSK